MAFNPHSGAVSEWRDGRPRRKHAELRTSTLGDDLDSPQPRLHLVPKLGLLPADHNQVTPGGNGIDTGTAGQRRKTMW